MQRRVACSLGFAGSGSAVALAPRPRGRSATAFRKVWSPEAERLHVKRAPRALSPLVRPPWAACKRLMLRIKILQQGVGRATLCISATVPERSAFRTSRFVEARGRAALALHHNTGDGAGGPSSSDETNGRAYRAEAELRRRLGNKMGGRVEARELRPSLSHSARFAGKTGPACPGRFFFGRQSLTDNQIPNRASVRSMPCR